MTRTVAVLLSLALTACSAPLEVGRQRVQDGAPRERIHGDHWPRLAAETGPSVIVRAGLTQVTGDFDGDTTLTGPDTIFVPDADDGTSRELGVGYRGRVAGFELAFYELRADGDVAGESADILMKGISLDGLLYFRTTELVQPYVLLGLGGYHADLDDASVGAGGRGDAELSNGFGLRLGGGAAWFWNRNLSLDLRLLLALIDFSDAEGVAGDEEEIDHPVDAPTWDLSLGLRYTF